MKSTRQKKEEEEVKVANDNDNGKVKITRPIAQYLAQSNKDLAKEIVKPKAIIEFNNIDFKSDFENMN